MLARILSDNPGQTFTRNFDAKFVDTARELLRNGRDLSVRQMLMETLDQFEHQKAWDEGLKGLIEMWKKEKEKAYKAYGVCVHGPLERKRERVETRGSCYADLGHRDEVRHHHHLYKCSSKDMDSIHKDTAKRTTISQGRTPTTAFRARWS